MTSPETQRVLDVLAAAATALCKDVPEYADFNEGVFEMTSVLLNIPARDWDQLKIILGTVLRHPHTHTAAGIERQMPTLWKSGTPVKYTGVDHMELAGRVGTVLNGAHPMPDGGFVSQVNFDGRVWILPTQTLMRVSDAEGPWLTWSIGCEVVCTSQPDRAQEWGRVVDYVRDTRQHKVLFKDGTYLFLHNDDMRNATEVEIAAWDGPA